MKKIFTLCAAVMMAATMFAGRTFDGTEILYLNAGYVSWWQDGDAVQRASFDGGDLVIGVPAADPSKVGFTVPAGTYETVVFSRASSATADPWNSTGAIPLDGTTGNMVATFAQNSTEATWGNYNGAGIDAPTCPDALYMIGNIENVGWTPGSGIAMIKNGNVFTGTATFVAEGTNTICYFCFTSSNLTDWADVNANRFGTKNTIVADAAGVELNYPGEKNATIAPGTYTITVDWDSMTVSAESITTALESTKVAQKAQKLIENGQVIFIKNGVRYNALGAAL